jgi:hypothetical protein
MVNAFVTSVRRVTACHPSKEISTQSNGVNGDYFYWGKVFASIPKEKILR